EGQMRQAIDYVLGVQRQIDALFHPAAAI
ncbi:IclR family transcriptional regulator, partial [Kaistia algarum]